LVGNALISVYNKSGLNVLATGFVKHHIDLIGSLNTAKAVRDLGFEITNASDYTGFPVILDGRVETIHPKIHAGILGDWSDPGQRKWMEANKVRPFDFVVVNIHPLQDTTKHDAKDQKRSMDMIEISDITLMYTAAIGAMRYQTVVPVTSPVQYDNLILELDRHGAIRPETRRSLAKTALDTVVQYDLAMKEYLSQSIR